jgi:hypothetical protein
MQLGKAASDVKLYIKLSAFKPILASWLVAALQQVTKETLIRGWEKHVSKNVLTIADYDYTSLAAFPNCIPLLSSSEYQFIKELLIFLLHSSLPATYSGCSIKLRIIFVKKSCAYLTYLLRTERIHSKTS